MNFADCLTANNTCKSLPYPCLNVFFSYIRSFNDSWVFDYNNVLGWGNTERSWYYSIKRWSLKFRGTYASFYFGTCECLYTHYSWCWNIFQYSENDAIMSSLCRYYLEKKDYIISYTKQCQVSEPSWTKQWPMFKLVTWRGWLMWKDLITRWHESKKCTQEKMV